MRFTMVKRAGEGGRFATTAYGWMVGAREPLRLGDHTVYGATVVGAAVSADGARVELELEAPDDALDVLGNRWAGASGTDVWTVAGGALSGFRLVTPREGSTP